MTNSNSPKPGGPSFGGRRKLVSAATTQMVTSAPLLADKPIPLVLQPAVEGIDLLAWAEHQRVHVDDLLHQQGALLFRGFQLPDVPAFERLMTTLSGQLLEYTYRSTPRSQVSGNVYTSTEYPADQHIPLHNEMSYARAWPLKIGFWSVIAAQEGGATPIADSRRVFERIDPAIRQRFAEKQVMYVRNYGDGLDLGWPTVFQTEDPAAVESFCQRMGIEVEWKPGQRLRTRQVCQAIAQHPTTGAWVWFNQAHLFHVSSLPPSVREMLLDSFEPADLPRHAYYGDGTPIEEAVLAEIRAAYDATTISFPWQQGDVMLLDNMLVAHGRAPFVGPRRVVVAMGEASTAQPQEYIEV